MSTRIPINRGQIGERDHTLAGMQSNMDTRRKEWEKEIEKMRSEFFTMSPSIRPTPVSAPSPHFGDSKIEEGKPVIEKDADGKPVYRAMFDLHEYAPDAVNVKTDDSKFVVTAKQAKHDGSTTLTREYNKQMDLPPDIDPLSLTCSMSAEGLLVVEAKIPTPAYGNIASVAKPAFGNVASTKSHAKTMATVHSDPTMGGKHEAKFDNVTVREKRAGDDTKRAGDDMIRPQQTRTVFSDPTLRTTVSTPGYTAQKSSDLRQSPITVDKSRHTYTIEVDIEDFKPEELNVKTIDGKLIVTATREDKTGSRTSTKQMTREFTIPNDVEPTSVKAFFTESGKLLIEAPYKQ